VPRLTDTQLVILSAAAKRDDGAVLPLPTSLKLKGGAATSLLKSLLKRGLVAERPASSGAPLWREDKDGQRVALVLTDAGRAAIGLETAEQAQVEGAAAKTGSGKDSSRGDSNRSTKPKTKSKRTSKTPSPAATRPGTKQALLLDLLQRKQGATIAEAVKATGWQPHSVRGAISGALKKKLGLTVDSAAVEGRGRVYRIVAGR
jgi:DNA-binding MarR family transcriptional regulator